MPKIRRNKNKTPPEGWELIEPTLDELDQKMREAETGMNEALFAIRILAAFVPKFHKSQVSFFL